MKIGQKLILGFAGITFLVGFVGYIGIRTFRDIGAIFEELKSNIVPGVFVMSDLDRMAVELDHAIMEYILRGKNDDKEESQAIMKNLEKLAAKHTEHERHIGLEEKKAAKEIEEKIKTINSIATGIINLKDQGAAAEVLWKKEDVEFDSASDVLSEQVTEHKAVHMEELAEAEKAIHRAHFFGVRALLSTTILIVLLAIVIALITTRLIVKPLHALHKGTEIIGAGNLDYKVGIDAKDEIGQLSIAFDKMTEDLKKITVSKDYLDNIIRSMIDSLVIVSPEGEIDTVNQAALDLLGYRKEELIGKDVSLLFPEEELSFRGTKLERLIEENRLMNYETNYKAKDGSRIPVLLSSAVLKAIDCPHKGPIKDCPVYKERGKHCEKILGIVCVAKDVTGRKKTEEEREALIKELEENQGLLKRQKQELENSRRAIKNVAMDIGKSKVILEEQKKSLEETNKELDDFTYIVSHDLKEPLRSIDAFSKFIIEDYKDRLDEEGKNYLGRIRANAGRMQALIEDLLEISRIERRRNPFGEVQVEELINEVKLRLEYAIKQKNAEIIIRDKLPRVFCDRIRFTEVFLNLISNALKFNNKSNPYIEIGCSEKDIFYEFYVKDNGLGIEERYFDKIFEIFQRLGKCEENEGTGAGLTIVKKIVQMHSGKIWMESKIGKGTTFYFTIPKEKGIILAKKKIGEILIEKRMLSEAELKEGLEEQKGRC